MIDKPVAELLDLLEKAASYAGQLEVRVAELESATQKLLDEATAKKLATALVKAGMVSKEDVDALSEDLQDPVTACNIACGVLEKFASASRGIGVYSPNFDDEESLDGWSKI